MGIFKRRRYEPPSIASSLDPYHYPVDESGNVIPTPSPRVTADIQPQGHGTRTVPAPDDEPTSPAESEGGTSDVIDLSAIEAEEAAGPAGSSPFEAAITNHYAAIAARSGTEDEPVGDPDDGTAHS